MRLIKINGNIWELTRLWDGAYGNFDSPHDCDAMTLDERNARAIHGHNIGIRGLGRLLSNNLVRSEATATIEITVGGLPQQNVYTIYHNSKGFYCTVQQKRVFLIDLL